MAKTSSNEARIPLSYWDGVNSAASSTIAKRSELSHAENARSPLIGVLEKRQGQSKVGTATNGAVFYTANNYGLTKFEISDTTYQGVVRVSATSTFSNTLTLSVFDYIFVIDYQGVVTQTTIIVKVGDNVSVSEPTIFSRIDGIYTTTNNNAIALLDGTSNASTIYSLTEANTWFPLVDASAVNIIGAQCDFAKVDGSLVVVNGKDYNRLLSANSVTVIDSTEAGSLYNSPRAKRAAFYKNRIYLANFIRHGVKYVTTILRSSYPLGIVSLVNGDHIVGITALSVSDAKYFYATSGMNSYDVYRGGTKIETITVSAVNETTVTVSATSNAINSSDEIWVAGTFSGEKQRRWVNNPTATGKDVKQYDTFKLSGGEEDEITLFDTIGNILIIGNKNTMMTWNDYTLQNFDLGIGCSSLNGSAKLLGTLYFLHYSGVYATTGDVPTLLSRKVERYIKGATKSGIENAAVGVKGLSVFFSIGNVTLYNADGSFWKTMPDTCLEYSVADKNWYPHTNVPAEGFTTFINTTGAERLLMSHGGAGKSVKEFLTGNTDDGAEVFFRADTQEIQLMKEFEVSSSPTNVITEVDRGSMMKTMVSLDDGDFKEIEGTNEKGATTLKITTTPEKMSPPLARRIKVSFRDSSKQICRIRQAAITYIPSSITVAK